MTEIIRPAEIANDPPAPEFIDLVDQFVFGISACRRQQPNRKTPADNGSNINQAPGAIRQLLETCLQHRPNRRREHGAAGIRRNAGPYGFNNKEWVAFGLLPQPRRRFRIELLSRSKLAGKFLGGRLVETFERNRRYRLLAIQGADNARQGVLLG